MQVVLDTNVLVSACWKPDGLEARTVRLAGCRAFTVCVSPEIVAEYREVLARKKLAAIHARAAAILAALERVWIIVHPARRLSHSLDEDDNRFLECADAAQAQYLVTGNLRHYPAICGQTQVVNARHFLAAGFAAELEELQPR